MIENKPVTKKHRGYFLAFLSAFLFVTVITLPSCMKNKNDQPAPDYSAVKFVHALTGVSSVDFYVGNQVATYPALGYTESTNYLAVYSGSAPMFVVLGGTYQALARKDVNLEPNKSYSLYATRISATNDSVSTYFTEDVLTPPAAGKAKIRFVNLTRDAANALDLGASGQANAYFSNQAYKSSSSFIEVAPATYTFQIKDTGTSTVRASQEATLAAGKIYTIWSSGLVGETSGNYQVGLEVSQN